MLLRRICGKIFYCKYNNMSYYVFPKKVEEINLNDFLIRSIKEVSECENNGIIRYY